jgi:hypothetical protein
MASPEADSEYSESQDPSQTESCPPKNFKEIKSLRNLIKVSSKVNDNVSKVQMNHNATKFKQNIMETLKE